jgi:hypothetical protein
LSEVVQAAVVQFRTTTVICFTGRVTAAQVVGGGPPVGADPPSGQYHWM